MCMRIVYIALLLSSYLYDCETWASVVSYALLRSLFTLAVANIWESWMEPT